jgi:hypothetical protein
MQPIRRDSKRNEWNFITSEKQVQELTIFFFGEYVYVYGNKTYRHYLNIVNPNSGRSLHHQMSEKSKTSKSLRWEELSGLSTRKNTVYSYWVDYTIRQLPCGSVLISAVYMHLRG